MHEPIMSDYESFMITFELELIIFLNMCGPLVYVPDARIPQKVKVCKVPNNSGNHKILTYTLTPSGGWYDTLLVCSYHVVKY